MIGKFVLLLISGILVSACDAKVNQTPDVAPGSANTPPPTPAFSPAETALIGLAHRRMGEQHTYHDEYISYDGGFAKVCGFLERADEPGRQQPFYFSLERRSILSDRSDPQWNMLCKTPAKGK